MTGTASGTIPRTGRRSVVQAARRHSLLVRSLRILLPVAAVLLIAGTVAAIMLDPRVMLAAEMDVANTSFSGSRIIMERPRLTGYGLDKDGHAKSYEVTAERAEQNLAKPNEIDLFELKAKMAMREDGWADLRAQSGRMNNQAQILDLFKRIQVTTDIGDRADLTKARVNFGAGEIISNTPVAISTGRADLTSNKMHLFENGQRAIFTGKVKMLLKPDPAEPVAPPSPQAQQ